MTVAGTREFAASSTRSVLTASEELRRELQAGTLQAHSVLRLESAARRSIDGLAEVEARGFDQAPTISPGDVATPPPEDVLSLALGQLSVAGALAAAQRAVDESSGQADAGTGTTGNSAPVLDEALGNLREATATLSAVPGRERQGFEAEPAGELDQPEAVRLCRAQVTSTLATLCDKAAGVATDSLTAAQKLAPQQVQDALAALGKKLSISEYGRGLARLALRALDSALGALSRLVPAPGLETLRERVRELWERLENGEVGRSVMAVVFAVRDTETQAEEVLSRDSLDVSRVSRAVADLAALAQKFSEHASLASTVVKVLVSTTAALGLLHVAVPHLSLITAGAVALVLGIVVVLGMDYADVEMPVHGVRGVRQVLRELAP